MQASEIREHYLENRHEIENRLEQFEKLRDASNQRLFKELVFVILTSQTSAKKAWEATEELDMHGMLEEGEEQEIAEILEENDVQYAFDKAEYIVSNRKEFSQPTLKDPGKGLKLKQKLDLENPGKAREWLVENVKGLGWKGASHFLRNVGYGEGFGIISRHILVKLSALGVISEASPPENEEKYIEIERKMKELADQIDIDVKALDLVLWSMETGEIFK